MSRKQQAKAPVPSGVQGMDEQQRVQWLADLEANRRKRLTRDLHALTSMGLYVADDNSALTRERAIMRVASAQLRAIKLAILCGEENGGHPDGWEHGDAGFTEVECGMALAGVISLLRHGPDIIDYVVDHSEDLDEESEAAE